MAIARLLTFALNPCRPCLRERDALSQACTSISYPHGGDRAYVESVSCLTVTV